MRAIISKRGLTYLIIAVIAALLMAAISLVRPVSLERAEGKILERFYRLRGPTAPSDRIVIAAVDEASIEKIGAWPWPHKTYVQIIKHLRAAGVKVIVFDADIADEVIGGDRRLRDSIAEHKDIVLGFDLYPLREDIPLDERAWATGADSFDVLTTQMIASTRVPLEHIPSMGGVRTVPKQLRVIGGTLGFTNLLPPKRGALTSVPMLVRYRNLILPSIALTTAARVKGFTPLVRKDMHDEVAAVTIGNHRIPLNNSGRMMLDAAGPAGTYRHLNIADVLDKEHDLSALKDAIVLIGSMQGAGAATPFGADIPAVEVWANAIDNALFGKPLVDTASSRDVTVGIILVIAVLLGLVLPRVRIVISFVIASAVALAVIIDGYLFFAYAHRWFAMMAPLCAIVLTCMAITVYRLATEERVRRKLMMRYGRFMGTKTITALVTKPARLPIKGEKRVMTAMTVGIRKFEHMCGELDAANLVAFIKGYYREVMPLLYDEDAYVVMAGNDKLACTLGAPILHSDHALRACRAALDIRRAIAKRRAGWKEQYRLGTLRLGAGIHTGPMAIGDAGNGFAAVGAPIDMSALWARVAQIYRVSIVCGPETVKSAREEFFFRPLDYVRVPHEQHPLEIYELMGKRSIAAPFMDIYTTAYEAYRERDYQSAVRAAEKVLENLPHDGPTLLIKARAERFLKNPPKKEWDGAWVVK